MAQIVHDAQVYMWPTHAFFTYRKLPQYSAVWYPWEFGDGALIQNSNVSTDYDKQYMTATPVRVPHNSYLGAAIDANYDTAKAAMLAASGADTSLPTVTWTALSSSGTGYLPAWGGQSTKGTQIVATAPSFAAADTNLSSLTASIGNHHGVSVFLYARPQPVEALAAGAQGGASSRVVPTTGWVGIKLTSGALWQVISTGNGDYKIQTDWGPGWYTVATIPRTTTSKVEGASYNEGQAEPPINVEWRLISGRLSIRVNDMTQVFTYIADYQTGPPPSSHITDIYAGASSFMSYSLFSEPLKWSVTGSSTSPLHNSPYSGMHYGSIESQDIDGGDTRYTHTLNTSAVDQVTGNTITSTDGPELRYSIDYAGNTDGTYLGTPYSNLTFAIRAYSMEFPTPVDYFEPQAPQAILPEHIIINSKFDPESLTVKSTSKMYFNNDDGSWGNNFMPNTGQVAIQIIAAAGPNTVANPYDVRFTGYGHRIGEVESTQGGSTFIMTCEDRMCQLHSPRWDLPRMDGWNQFYAAAYLMQLGGISTNDMAFRDLIPNHPFDDLGDQYGQPAPFLPIGDNGSLLNRYANGYLDELLIKQANPIGYCVFQDVYGYMHFEKFYLPVGVKQVYYDSDWESAAYPNADFGLTMSSVRKDMTQVRSDVGIIGINAYSPYWNPVMKRRPTDPSTNPIIFDTGAYNHLGYPNPAQWIDGIFANEDFADAAADLMYNVFSLPGLDAVLPTMWLQPNIFPLDVIAYAGDRVDIGSLPLLVTEVTHDISIARATTTITGRYVPGAPTP